MLPLKGSLDTEPINRYFNLAFKTEIIQKGINKLSHNNNIVSVLHPHEVMPNKFNNHLISYDPNSMEINLKNLIKKIHNLNFKLLSSISNNEIKNKNEY